MASYVESHTQLGSTLAQAKAEMEAAAKAAQEEARKKAADRGKKGTEKPATGGKSAAVASGTPPRVATMTLFEGSQPTAAASGASPTATKAEEQQGGISTCKLAL